MKGWPLANSLNSREHHSGSARDRPGRLQEWMLAAPDGAMQDESGSKHLTISPALNLCKYERLIWK